MTQQTINVGSSANDKTGDPIRTAFIKVNQNFFDLYTHVLGAGIIVSTTAPSSPVTGTLWYDEVSGRMYIFFSNAWVDTNPATAETITLSTIKSVVAASTNFADFQDRIAAL